MKKLILLSLLLSGFLFSLSSVYAQEAVDEVQLRELTFQLEELNQKYELAAQGMSSGSTGVGLAAGVVILIVVASAITFGMKGKSFMGGPSISFSIFSILGALVLYFSFIFDREANLRAEISETNKTLQFVTQKCD